LRVRTPIDFGGGSEEDFTLSTTMQTFEVSTKVRTAVENAYFGLLAPGTFYIDDVSLTSAGAVVEYDGSGITNDKWYDKSGNQLHGTVSGATDENTAGAPVISANHPAFMARPSGTQSNIGANSTSPINFATQVFDQDGNFDHTSATVNSVTVIGHFIAPVTGRYLLSFQLRLQTLDSAADYYQAQIITSNRTYDGWVLDPDFGQDNNYFPIGGSVLADMDAGDFAYIAVHQGAGSSQTDIHSTSFFSGYLAC